MKPISFFSSSGAGLRPAYGCNVGKIRKLATNNSKGGSNNSDEVICVLSEVDLFFENMGFGSAIQAKA